MALELESGATLADALDVAAELAPAVAASLSRDGRLIVSLNAERAPRETPLEDGDEIALLPPMSGGSGRPWLQAQPLSMDALLAEVRGPDCGGEVTFTGLVRDFSRGERIAHLEYEAYEPMARREMEAIVAQARERWPEVRLAMSHRVGHLNIGDAAVMIAAAAPHRVEAFEACRFAIDTLKQTVPIWKKEFAEGGAYWVDENP